MSGGHFYYKNEELGCEMKNEWRDAVLNELFYDMFCAPLWGHREGGLATALDYYLAGDIGEGTYREYVNCFKKKWFGDKNVIDKVTKKYIDDKVEELRKRMYVECGLVTEEELEEEHGV